MTKKCTKCKKPNCFNISGLKEPKGQLPLKLNLPPGKMLHGILLLLSIKLGGTLLGAK